MWQSQEKIHNMMQYDKKNKTWQWHKSEQQICSTAAAQQSHKTFSTSKTTNNVMASFVVVQCLFQSVRGGGLLLYLSVPRGPFSAGHL